MLMFRRVTLGGAAYRLDPADFNNRARPEGRHNGLRGDRSLHQVQVYGLRRGLPRRLFLRRRQHGRHQPQ